MASIVLISILLVAYSSTVHLIPGFNALYVPISLATTALLAVMARRLGLKRSDLALETEHRKAGLTAGAVVALVAAFGLAIATAIPALHPLFRDARLGDIGFGLVLYRALIRIPFGTAILEEFAFRGVLFGIWARISGRWSAAVGSSIVFGMWHIRPALDLLNANETASTTLAQSLLLLGAVLGTVVAGLFFSYLRIRTDSLWAPLIAHASINSLAIVAAALVNGWTQVV